jgi:hypothetical protein
MSDNRLEIGTKVYLVEEDNLAFRRKKIFKTDENGVEWYRYEQPLRTQSLTELEIVGRVLVTVEGRVPSVENHIDTYYLDNGDEIDEGCIDTADTCSGYFLNREDALDWIQERKAEVVRIEQS